ncbi:hypothetical protein HUU53_01100 [Candidatus Micrarchaeota archaeon]|nr:hypothetical protein [Candidatus Micrarchaeota archaeon]
MKKLLVLLALFCVGCVEQQDSFTLPTLTPTPISTITPTPSPTVNANACLGDDYLALSVANSFNQLITPLINEKVSQYGYCHAGEFFSLCKQISGFDFLDLNSVYYDGSFSFEFTNNVQGYSQVIDASLYSGNPDWAEEKISLSFECDKWVQGEKCVFYSNKAEKFTSTVRDNNPLVLTISMVNQGRIKRLFSYACR